MFLLESTTDPTGQAFNVVYARFQIFINVTGTSFKPLVVLYHEVYNLPHTRSSVGLIIADIHY